MAYLFVFPLLRYSLVTSRKQNAYTSKEECLLYICMLYCVLNNFHLCIKKFFLFSYSIFSKVLKILLSCLYPNHFRSVVPILCPRLNPCFFKFHKLRFRLQIYIYLKAIYSDSIWCYATNI